MASTLLDQFEAAIRKSYTMSKRPDNQSLLKLYGLYKQATVGDVNRGRPSGFDIRSIAKYEAWAAQKGVPKDIAMSQYIIFVDELYEEYK